MCHDDSGSRAQWGQNFGRIIAGLSILTLRLGFCTLQMGGLNLPAFKTHPLITVPFASPMLPWLKADGE